MNVYARFATSTYHYVPSHLYNTRFFDFKTSPILLDNLYTSALNSISDVNNTKIILNNSLTCENVEFNPEDLKEGINVLNDAYSLIQPLLLSIFSLKDIMYTTNVGTPNYISGFAHMAQLLEVEQNNLNSAAIN
jgi:hypothetical protein